MKPIKLEYAGGTEGVAGDCKDSVNVKLFFRPTSKIGEIPAWYVYFKQGPIPYLQLLTPVKEDDPVWDIDESLVDKDAYGFFVVYEQSWSPKPKPNIGASALYISQSHPVDVAEIAGTVAHELGHQVLTKQVADAYNAIIKQFQDESITQEEYENLYLAVDADDDQVIETIDKNIGSDDQEAWAEAIEEDRKAKILDKSKDWSEGGHNYVSS